MRDSSDLDSISRRDGWLQRSDPRYVLVLLIGLVFATVFCHNIISFVSVITLANVMAATSRVPMTWYARRVWLVVPLFTIVILVPSMTSLVTPGRQVGWDVAFLGRSIYFTSEGLLYSLAFTLRVGAAVSLSVLLVATVEWSRLTRAMALLGLPATFITILDMTWRYIHLLLDSVTTMFLARKSRMAGKPTPGELRSIGTSSVAALFHRSLVESEAVYGAMVSRGYAGQARILARFRSRPGDIVFASLAIAFGLVLLAFDSLAAHDAMAALLRLLEAGAR
jgi:cobalt/nickel transport system permease protein